jgi:hypothetical protein
MSVPKNLQCRAIKVTEVNHANPCSQRFAQGSQPVVEYHPCTGLGVLLDWMKGRRRESVKFVPKAFPYRISVTTTEIGKKIKGRLELSSITAHHLLCSTEFSNKEKGYLEIWME